MQPTIVMYSALAHTMCMVELAQLILRHDPHKFSITILIIPSVVHNPALSSTIQGISNSNPSISFHRLPSQPVHTSSPSKTPPGMPAILCETARLSLPNAQSVIHEISKTSPVKALIVDMFSSPAIVSLGVELGIPTFFLFNSGASALAVFLNLPKLHGQANDSFKNLAGTLFRIPGVPPLKATDMPTPVLDRNHTCYWDFLSYWSNIPKAKGILVNTFDGFEPMATKAIGDGLCVADGPTPPLYWIGPLINGGEKEGKAVEEKEDYLSWLDKQPSRSVVYLCFGRLGTFSEKQVREIAMGLENSGKRFLWALKKPAVVGDFNLGSILPEGFTERTRGTGVVVTSWVSQLEVLKKESVGGFVTHCGWNSVIEAVVTGVPMIAWPLYAEQHVNRNALVEDMKMAIPVEQRGEDRFVSGAELEKRVRELMESEKGMELRKTSAKLKEVSLAALRDRGSSISALKRFIGNIE